jgi:leucyl/phenylalanyl-tRNA---protein transferase
MRVPFLQASDPLPAPEDALTHPNGLVAAGGALTPERLLAAYKEGIFPWYSDGDPVLWWSPNPRMVLQTHAFKLRKSLAKRIRAFARAGDVTVRVDTDFAAVIAHCASARAHAGGTWIVPDIVDVYCAMHTRGIAHSVEVRRSGALIGGLYGMCVGRMFFGESMFTAEPDASKLALAALVHICLQENMPWIDCQQETAHLAFMGAQPMPRAQFLQGVRQLVTQSAVDWPGWKNQNLLDGLLNHHLRVMMAADGS